MNMLRKKSEKQSPHDSFKIFLGVNLNKDTKDLYSRNLKTLKRN